jgi:Spy/CpxP family protein refolding chaperone
MKRSLLLTLGIAAVVSLLALSGCWRGYGPGCYGDPGKMMEKELKDLNLTPAQKTQVDTIRKNMEEDMNKHREKMLSIREDVLNEIDKPNPDINALAANIKARFTAQSNPGVKMTDYFIQFYSVLDKDQQKKVLEKIRQWEKKHPAKGCHAMMSRKGCPMADN